MRSEWTLRHEYFSCSMRYAPKFTSRKPTLAGCLAIVALLANGCGELCGQSTAASPAVADEPVLAIELERSRRELHSYLSGRHLFQKHCADCHGESGRGNGPWAAELEIKPRNFRTGLFKFRTTPYGALPVDEDLIRTIKSGISGTSMPVFACLPDHEIAMIIKYLQTLSRSWRDRSLVASPLSIPEVPDWLLSQNLSRKPAERGRARFANLCASCHGERGKGDGVAASQLIDAWENPIVPADLSAAHHKSGDSARDLYRSVATGLNGTPMIGFAGQLSETEIWELIAFIRRLGKSGESGGGQ